MEAPSGKVIFSGIQPSGDLHIGNYLGAIRQWVKLQEGNTAYYCIVDEHAITVPYSVEKLPDRILDVAAVYMAAGVDPEKSVIFVQSQVPAHTQLAWLLGVNTPMGELRRMTQFKEKEAKQKKESSLGLFSYPVLMAADILLYKASVVPVGEDQTQHIELTRDIAERFNNKYGEVFVVPEAYLKSEVARIMSLDDPTKKMGKSDASKTQIGITDEPKVIEKKIMGAMTETEPVISFEKSGPAIKNLLNIYKAFTEETQEEIEEKFEKRGHKEFKEALAQVVIQGLAPFQKKYKRLRQDDDNLRVMLGRGQHKATQVATQTLQEVKRQMGLL